MDKETKQRLEAVEGRLAALENRPVAALEVTEGKKSRRGTNPHNLSDEERAEHGKRLQAGKAAAKARREAAQAEAEVPAEPEPTEVELATIEAESLPEDKSGIANRWDNALTVSQRTKLVKKIGLSGTLGSSSWEGLPKADKALIIESQNAKAKVKEAK